ncbi:20800_t:CDS:2 [Gigaspora margarita]|uniref:20800_t:CDS:1 n=1 Tax=Gigaspora margarita TaxID=4874 RepID=A0ABN7ULE5_GIGMA|nr:20800_t:CDS:2 [Gigaspora margarita]
MAGNNGNQGLIQVSDFNNKNNLFVIESSDVQQSSLSSENNDKRSICWKYFESFKVPKQTWYNTHNSCSTIIINKHKNFELEVNQHTKSVMLSVSLRRINDKPYIIITYNGLTEDFKFHKILMHVNYFSPKGDALIDNILSALVKWELTNLMFIRCSPIDFGNFKVVNTVYNDCLKEKNEDIIICPLEPIKVVTIRDIRDMIVNAPNIFTEISRSSLVMIPQHHLEHKHMKNWDVSIQQFSFNENDLCKWWQNSKHILPRLATLAVKYLPLLKLNANVPLENLDKFIDAYGDGDTVGSILTI